MALTCHVARFWSMLSYLTVLQRRKPASVGREPPTPTPSAVHTRPQKSLRGARREGRRRSALPPALDVRKHLLLVLQDLLEHGLCRRALLLGQRQSLPSVCAHSW